VFRRFDLGSMGLISASILLGCSARSQEVEIQPVPPAPHLPVSVWGEGIGNRFQIRTVELGFSVGAGIGHKILNDTRHGLALSAIDFGWTLTDLVGRDHWYRGNWELIGEIFGGAQYSPDTAYVGGGVALVRYNFDTHSRWTPFVNLGAGAAGTNIRDGDLSTAFEFTLQAGVGAHYFLTPNLALTGQYRYVHLSNAGIEYPNLGVNTSMFYIGATWFFGPGRRRH